jgi:hypothetical protein
MESELQRIPARMAAVQSAGPADLTQQSRRQSPALLEVSQLRRIPAIQENSGWKGEGKARGGGAAGNRGDRGRIPNRDNEGMGIRGGEAEEERAKASFLSPDLLQNVVKNSALAIVGVWRFLTFSDFGGDVERAFGKAPGVRL